MADDFRLPLRAIVALPSPSDTLREVRVEARRRRLRAMQQSAFAGVFALVAVVTAGAIGRGGISEGLVVTSPPRLDQHEPAPGDPGGLTRRSPTPSASPQAPPPAEGSQPRPAGRNGPGMPADVAPVGAGRASDGLPSGQSRDGGNPGPEPGTEPQPGPTSSPTPSASGDPAPDPAPSQDPSPSPSPTPSYAQRPAVTENTQAQTNCPVDQETQSTGWCRWVTAGAVSNGVRFTFLVCRAAGQTQRNVTFSTEQELDVEVSNASGAVWTWSLGQMFRASPHTETIAPASCHTWSLVWAWTDDYGNRVAAGDYSVSAYSTGAPVADFGSSAATFSVT